LSNEERLHRRNCRKVRESLLCPAQLGLNFVRCFSPLVCIVNGPQLLWHDIGERRNGPHPANRQRIGQKAVIANEYEQVGKFSAKRSQVLAIAAAVFDAGQLSWKAILKLMKEVEGYRYTGYGRIVIEEYSAATRNALCKDLAIESDQTFQRRFPVEERWRNHNGIRPQIERRARERNGVGQAGCAGPNDELQPGGCSGDHAHNCQPLLNAE